MDVTYRDISEILKISPQSRQSIHIDKLLDLTKDVQFFQKITVEQDSNDIHRECCKVMDLEEFGADEFIFNFGDIGEKFYIILKGSVSVKTPIKKKVLVSKKAANKIEGLLQVDSDSEEDSRGETKREGYISINVSHVKECMSPIKFSQIDQQDENQVILDSEEKTLLNLFKKTVRHEQRIIMDIIRHSTKDQIEIELDDLGEIGILSTGSSFGELALISNRPRSATIQTREKSIFLVLSKTDFTKILGGVAGKRLSNLIKFLQNIPYFSSRSKASLIKLAYYFQVKKFKKSQIIYKECDVTDGIYFIKDGEVMISKKQESKKPELPSQICRLPFTSVSKLQSSQKLHTDVKIIIKGQNESFGGFETLNQIESRCFTCTCASSSAEILFLSKMNFLSRMPYLDLIKDHIEVEHLRIIERYTELCGSNQTVAQSQETHSLSPLVTKRLDNSIIESKSGQRLKLNFNSKKLLPKLKQCNTSFLRRLTANEVNEAINGRSPLKRRYGHQANYDGYNFTPIYTHLKKKKLFLI